MLMRYLLLPVVLLAAPVHADSEVEQLLAGDEMPVGVVFEIVEDEEDALGWALPRVRDYSRRLRERFPDLPIAVVTHGSEQFALLSREADGELSGIHDAARSLRDDDIDLHVCGAHAGWYGHVSEDFPSYVDVSPSGPAQINDYANLGYEVIRLQSDHP